MAENATEGKSPGASSVDQKGKQSKDVFQIELDRVRESMQREKQRIRPAHEKEFMPNVHNSLQPFFDTQWFEKFLETPRVPKHSYASRWTASTLVDPWQSHKMDASVLPEIPHEHKTKPSPRRSREDSKKEMRKAGSTRLPPWPVVDIRFNGKRKDWTFDDVPHLREVLRNKYTANADDKQKKDYKRTKEDFYRMKLDQLDEVPGDLNRRNLRLAYHAYLKNTPGSRQALLDCLGNLHQEKDQDEKNASEQSPPQATHHKDPEPEPSNEKQEEEAEENEEDGEEEQEAEEQ